MSDAMDIGPARGQASHAAGTRLGRVLVVDDDTDARHHLTSYLTEEACPALGVPQADAPRHLQRDLFSLVVIDLRRAPCEGFDLVRRIRGRSEVPIILVAGQRHGVMDRVLGLELGADDVLCEPLDPRELLARARATLRRQEIGRRLVGPAMRGGYRFLGWELEHATRALRNPCGEQLDLTKSEYALLIALLEAPRRTLSRLQLMRATRAHDDISDRSIDVQIMRLRRKIERNPSAPDLIKTRRGMGYMFDAPVEKTF